MKAISKKVLLASLCFIILLAAVGAYSYVEISRLNNHMSDLESQIEELQDEIDHLQNELSHMNSTKTFVFEWPPSAQNIVNGTLRMELTFTLKQENLSIVAKINDDEYDAGVNGDYLGLVFDTNDDGKLEGESAGVAFADNTTISAFLDSKGVIVFAFMEPMPSAFHTCVFQPNVGYTFNVSLPLSRLKNTSNDLVFVCYVDDLHGVVFVRFHLGLPLRGS